MFELTITIPPDYYELKTVRTISMVPAPNTFDSNGLKVPNVFTQEVKRNYIPLLTFGEKTLSLADINALWKTVSVNYGESFDVIAVCLQIKFTSYFEEVLQSQIQVVQQFLDKIFETHVKL